MNTTLNRFRLRVFGRPRPALTEPDPADMGTCFGLEMTMTLDDERAPPSDRAGQAAARAHWWQRGAGGHAVRAK